MTSFLDLLGKWFGPTFDIAINGDSVEFRSDEKFLSLPAVLEYDPDSERLVSVGGRPLRSGAGINILLLEPSEIPEGRLTREDFLEAFFRYGFGEMVGRKTMIRPLVWISGSGAFHDSFGDKSKPIVMRACLRAGAREVHFVS